MFLRTLAVAVFSASVLLAQDTPQTSPTDPQPDKTVERAKSDGSKSVPPKVCSVPLINVRPRSKPYMPNFLPKTPTHPMSIAPPAPPCDDERESPPVPLRKNPKLEESPKH